MAEFVTVGIGYIQGRVWVWVWGWGNWVGVRREVDGVSRKQASKVPHPCGQESEVACQEVCAVEALQGAHLILVVFCVEGWVWVLGVLGRGEQGIGRRGSRGLVVEKTPLDSRLCRPTPSPLTANRGCSM